MIPPGEAGYLHATVDTTKLRGEVARGITVQTNDPVRPKFFLSLRTVVQTSAILLPLHSINLVHDDQGGVLGEVLVRQDPTESGRLEIADVETSEPWFRASARRLDEHRRAVPERRMPAGRPGDWLIELDVVGKPRYGRTEQWVRFSTGLAREPRIRVPVVTNLQPPVSLNTEQLVVPPGDGTRRQQVIISVREGLDASGLRVESVPPSLALELVEAGARYYRMYVAWPPDDETRGVITFHLGEESYSLPVRRGEVAKAPARRPAPRL